MNRERLFVPILMTTFLHHAESNLPVEESVFCSCAYPYLIDILYSCWYAQARVLTISPLQPHHRGGSLCHVSGLPQCHQGVFLPTPPPLMIWEAETPSGLSAPSSHDLTLRLVLLFPASPLNQSPAQVDSVRKITHLLWQQEFNIQGLVNKIGRVRIWHKQLS